MSLADFIVANLEPILDEWEAFARSLPPGQRLSSNVLRQDAERMLRFVAADMKSAQTPEQQVQKSRGQASSAGGTGGASAARDIGFRRQSEGFGLLQLVGEYRVLRASVIRLWTQSTGSEEDAPRAELVRFNESIDQMLGESVERFVERMDRSRELLLTVLGHDLRNPLSAISLSGAALVRSDLEPREHDMAMTVVRSSERMQAMVFDLLDFTRTRLGAPPTIRPERCDLCQLVQNIVEELRAAHPSQSLSVHCSGDGVGHWDQQRIERLISNLVANAIEHGDRGSDVRVEVSGEDPNVVTFSVINRGPVIPVEQRQVIFDPFARVAGIVGDQDPVSGSLGLGLYIAKEIATAHGGTIEVASSDDAGTTFRVHLPRAARRLAAVDE